MMMLIVALLGFAVVGFALLYLAERDVPERGLDSFDVPPPQGVPADTPFRDFDG